MRSEIVLIGPMAAGKSTLGKLLSKKLGVRGASLDAVGEKYYAEAGFDLQKARTLRESKGELIGHRYFERFLLPALEKHLQESKGCVIDLGAGHSVYWDETDFGRVQNLLAPYRNVLLILPSPDLEESAAILRERTKEIAWLNRIREQNGFDMNERYLRHHSNFDLAKYTVYTKNKSPEETRDEILDLLNLPTPPTATSPSRRRAASPPN